MFARVNAVWQIHKGTVYVYSEQSSIVKKEPA